MVNAQVAFAAKFLPEIREKIVGSFSIGDLMQLKSIKAKIGDEDFGVYIARVIKSGEIDQIYFNPPTDDANKYLASDIRDKEIHLSERISIVSLPCRVCKSPNTKSIESSNRGMDEGGTVIVECLACGAHYREA